MIETLNEVDGNRKCFRMIGGVLVERTVKEVLPSLENNKEKASLEFAIWILIILNGFHLTIDFTIDWNFKSSNS